MLKALVIQGSFKDVGDLVRVASAQGKRLYNGISVNVLDVFMHRPYGHVVVIKAEGREKRDPSGEDRETEPS